MGFQGRRSKKTEQSYWSSGLNQTKDFHTRIQDQEETKCGVSYTYNINLKKEYIEACTTPAAGMYWRKARLYGPSLACSLGNDGEACHTSRHRQTPPPQQLRGHFLSAGAKLAGKAGDRKIY